MLVPSGLPLLAVAIESLLTLLTLSGLAYSLIALWAARDFAHSWKLGRNDEPEPSPDVSILKSVNGIDARMYAGFRTHCLQQYAGGCEIIFGVNSLADPAIAEIDRLREEFPATTIRVLECPERLGISGKISNLIQMLRVAEHEHIVINDSDIAVSPRYLENLMRSFRIPQTGLVTALYVGVAGERAKDRTMWAKLEALGISTDFMPGVLTARKLEGGIRFGLGSTLATTKSVLEKIGGLESLADYLADDYELGLRISQAGFNIELCSEAVETTVPAYKFRGFWDHQTRWARSMRDSRKAGYLGLGVTYSVPLAVMTILASGFALWSFTLFSVVLLARVALALSVGVGILRDGQVLRDLWLLPLRDFVGLAVWVWSFAGDTVVWRSEKFRLQNGVISRLRPREVECPK